jgi:DNA (cytosine-5)-methyltransferase 1
MNRKLKVVELYSGVARTWEAFRSWQRCQLGLLVDIDQLAIDNYKDNYPSVPYLKRDLRWMKPSEIEAKAGGRVDILLGCPPCQGFSDTGKRDPDDPRNIHIDVFGRFVRGLKPMAIAMENVPLVVNSRRFTRFTRMLDSLRYQWTAQIVNAAQYGSCQTRQRLLLVAVHSDVKTPPCIIAPTHGPKGRYFSYQQQKLLPAERCETEFLGITPASARVGSVITVNRSISGAIPVPNVGQVLAGLPGIGTADAQALTHFPWPSSLQMRRRMSRVPEGGRWRGGEDHFSHSYGRLHRRGLARTITTYFANAGSGRFWHPVDDRPLTIREAARIQGFDDDFWFHGPLAGIGRLVGNSLDNAIAQVACGTVKACLES